MNSKDILGDNEIITLFFSRDEAAIDATTRKYGAYCNTVSLNILADPQDAQECVNDTYNTLWRHIPPDKPEYLKAYIGKIVRNISLDRLDYKTAAKRKGTLLVYDELSETFSDSGSIEDDFALKDALDGFLSSLPDKSRVVFVRRYWYFDSVEAIAKRYSISESLVKSILFRTRNKLREFLKKEGIGL